MDNHWRRWSCLILFVRFGVDVFAAGSGLNVVVVMNQNSTDSVQLGNYYCERRQVPPQNVLRINWAGGNATWTTADFDTYLGNPFLAMLASRQLTNRVDYVVLSMDIPHQVTATASTANSSTATLFYGFKPDPSPNCSLAPGSTSAYAGSEGIFRSTPPLGAGSNSWLVTMITGSNLPSAKLVVDSGVNSDGTFPTQTVYLAKSTDIFRNVRFLTFDGAIFNTRLRGNYSMTRTNYSNNFGLGSCLGLQQGVVYSGVDPNMFVPGSMADNLTSYGGMLFQDNGGQLKLLAYLASGAAGSYGTVTEPCNYLEKFPSPQNYFYQARGFSLAESYYMSVTNPYHGLIVGEPLAAPFARPPTGAWSNLPANALLSGTTNLNLQFNASDGQHPVQQVDLYVDGAYLQTLTNIPPTQGNLVTVTVNGQPMSFSVQPNATLGLVANGMAALMNAAINVNTSRVVAVPHGDRIELKAQDRTPLGRQMPLGVSSSIGSGAAAMTFITASGTNLLDSIAYGLRYFQFDSGSTYPPSVGAWLQLAVTKTNGAVVIVGVTNATLGTTVPQMVSSLISQLNATPQLAGSDGCEGQDFVDYAAALGDPSDHRAEFNLLARGYGWPAAQLQATFTSSADFTFTPGGTQTLEDNIGDLQPQAHLYLAAGATQLSVAFSLDTTVLPDGYHELTAVGYEGSHVRTQRRVPVNVRVQNTTLSATFSMVSGASNTLLGVPLVFSVAANSSAIARIELFSTGGSQASVTGQSNATFTVASTNLGLGLHPVYALVTANSGKQYRTETKWVRLVNSPDAPITLAITAPPPTLSWPATAGRSYDVLSATSLLSSFVVRSSLTPTNSPALWTETNAVGARRYYRVRTSN